MNKPFLFAVTIWSLVAGIILYRMYGAFTTFENIPTFTYPKLDEIGNPL